MNMIFSNYPFDNPYLKGIARLAYKLPHAKLHITFENLVAVFRHPDKVVLNVKYRVAAVAVFHR